MASYSIDESHGQADRVAWTASVVTNVTAFFHDLKVAFRSLGRAPALWITVALTLALGIGMNAAIFSIVRGVLLSFQQVDFVNPPTWVGLANFQRLFADPVFGQAWRNTLLFTGLALVLGFAAPFAVAIVLNEIRHAKGYFRLAVYLPVILGLALFFGHAAIAWVGGWAWLAVIAPLAAALLWRTRMAYRNRRAT